jgi:hypothetical protein
VAYARQRSGSALMISLLESEGGDRRFEPPPPLLKMLGPQAFAVHGDVRVALRSLEYPRAPKIGGASTYIVNYAHRVYDRFVALSGPHDVFYAKMVYNRFKYIWFRGPRSGELACEYTKLL